MGKWIITKMVSNRDGVFVDERTATLRARSVANRKQNDHHKGNDYDVHARALSHRPQSQRQSVQSIGEKLTAKAWAHVTYPNWISTKAD
jgi:hypothetical protein